MSNPDNWRHKVRVLERLGYSAGNRVLDYGCGAGATVQSLSEAGFDAHGFDVVDYVETARDRISIGPADRLPYPDGYFDAVFSDQVFEHAKAQDGVFAELHRVTRPGGVHMHIIPAKWQIIEPHMKVPLGGIVTFMWWYRLWAALGIRNEFQQGLTVEQTALMNWEFNRDGLNYVTTWTYRRLWRKLGFRMHFIERDYMAASDKPKVRKLARLAGIPGFTSLIRTFWVRIAVLEKAGEAKAHSTGPHAQSGSSPSPAALVN